MYSRLLNLLTLLSLLLCVAVAALWVRGQWVVDVFYCRTVRSTEASHTTDHWQLVSGRGIVSVTRQRHVTDRAIDPPRPYGIDHQTVRPDQLRIVGGGLASPLGFHWFRDSDLGLQPAFSVRGVRLPCWFLLASAAIPPALWTRSVVTLRKRRHGMCASCGYDLRATPDHCPECGTRSA